MDVLDAAYCCFSTGAPHENAAQFHTASRRTESMSSSKSRFLSSRFNMPHDDSNKCKEDGVKIQQHVMAPTLNYNTNPWMWSKCSRKYITEFLEYVALVPSRFSRWLVSPLAWRRFFRFAAKPTAS